MVPVGLLESRTHILWDNIPPKNATINDQHPWCVKRVENPEHLRLLDVARDPTHSKALSQPEPPLGVGSHTAALEAQYEQPTVTTSKETRQKKLVCAGWQSSKLVMATMEHLGD